MKQMDAQEEGTTQRGMRLRLVIAYDGSGFRGWQSQAGGGTVQDCLEAAFKTLCGTRVPVHGAGRTDAGVHALGQCAHADVTREMDWVTALNGNLPREIRVLKCSRARGDFHARFSAKGKIYTYRIVHAAVLPPFELRRAWHVPGPLDLEAMRRAARALEGRHDFKAFAANRGKPEEDTTRTIYKVSITRRGPAVTLRFHGDGFLYKMVRLMTGALVKTGQGRAPVESIAKYLEGSGGKCSFAAPAEGLYLARVIY
jgi:tRNA pseudouridine38-40 synthase